MDSDVDVARLRKEYTLRGLRRADLSPEPLAQFEAWFREALGTAGANEPNAMALATATPEGAPSVRVVLLKGFGPDGFRFYTNYGSRKGEELRRNPRAALDFHWPWLERQVIVEGPVERLSREESAEYFELRPVGSRRGALASRQSQVVRDRARLDEQLARVEAEHGDRPPLPDDWGGFRLKPARYEFWQGRQNRMHDRFEYQVGADGAWAVERLSP